MATSRSLRLKFDFLIGTPHLRSPLSCHVLSFSMRCEFDLNISGLLFVLSETLIYTFRVENILFAYTSIKWFECCNSIYFQPNRFSIWIRISNRLDDSYRKQFNFDSEYLTRKKKHISWYKFSGVVIFTNFSEMCP